MRGLSERVGPAWGTSAEEIRMECGSGSEGQGHWWQCTPVAGSVQSHALGCRDVTETLQVPAWCTAAHDPDVGSGEVGSGEGGA